MNGALQFINDITTDSFSSDEDRIRTRDAAAALVTRLETPWETLWRLNWSDPAASAALRLCVDLNLFGKWTLDDRAQSAFELAKMTGTDPPLLSRFLLHLASVNMLETDGDVFQMTPFTRSLAGDGMLHAVKLHSYIMGPAFVNLPKFCATINYTYPRDQNNCNWQHMRGSSDTMFDLFAKDPAFMECFSKTMTTYEANKTAWTKLFPVKRLIEAEGPIVDVAGGVGHDLDRVASKFPDLPHGKLILQDLPDVIALANPSSAVTKMVHDMFTPQPIKGAAAFYLHMILHDWPDDKAVEILSRLADAMESHSRILIHEQVGKTSKPSMNFTSSDITMLAVFSAKERTEPMWAELAHAAGLKIVKTWDEEGGIEAVIELELAH